MTIFSDMALHSDMPVEIPWSNWGPQHAYYFPHHESHHISVFGSKMAYALPQDRIPDPGQRLEGLSVLTIPTHQIFSFASQISSRIYAFSDVWLQYILGTGSAYFGMGSTWSQD
ncbi:hypothetical protein EV702DRAFT_1043567 [Suillus placidus]|uniref:Uncharacterized protein n=1 Tax=Suillus placidus TaxID=48579 RepID=A0A9P6ZZW7_9AGAM|nr:hypothetical protein EV702DRAFT_1043567 [Suillus placidus]